MYGPVFVGHTVHPHLHSMASAVGAAGGSSSGGGGMPGGLSAKQQKLFELRMRMV